MSDDGVAVVVCRVDVVVGVGVIVVVADMIAFGVGGGVVHGVGVVSSVVGVVIIVLVWW